MAARPYHHGALDTALLDAALDVVREAGIGAVALRDLARTTGVSPSAAYRHFPSRDHLIARVAQIARQMLAAELIAARTPAGQSDDARQRSIEQLEAIGTAYVTFALHHPRLFEAAFVRCDSRPDSPDDPDAWLVLVDAIDCMIDAGAVPEPRRADAPLIAWAGVHGLAQILTASIWPEGVSADHHIDAVVKGLTRALL